jgi:S-adenosylmethionine/arginine decarboxylase-like enzyme
MYLPFFSIVSFLKATYEVSSMYKPLMTIKDYLGKSTQEEKNFKGTHIFADYKGLTGDETEIGNFIFNLMQDAIINASTMKIVHKNLVILNKDTQGVDTPPGFTSGILLLDSSHFTCHCYANKEDGGLLALDIFTCGSDDTSKIIQYFENKIIEKYPSVKQNMVKTCKRFEY